MYIRLEILVNEDDTISLVSELPGVQSIKFLNANIDLCFKLCQCIQFSVHRGKLRNENIFFISYVYRSKVTDLMAVFVPFRLNIYTAKATSKPIPLYFMGL